MKKKKIVFLLAIMLFVSIGIFLIYNISYEEKYNSLLASYEQNKPCKVTVISESNEKANITISNLQIKNIINGGNLL